MAQRYSTPASEVILRVSSTYPAAQLLPATAARCAAELGRQYKREIPSAEIDRVLSQFEQRLMTALDAIQDARGGGDDAAVWPGEA